MQLLEGVGPTSAARVLDHIAATVDPIAALAEAPEPARAGEDWYGVVEMVQLLRANRSGWPAEMGRARLWYEPYLERMHEDAVLRRANLLQLEQIASRYPTRTLFDRADP
jgi:DNA helicase-2/ATP-dependent DNA helicase PcrA